jgi:preprotein translocase subunit SecE
MVSTVESQKLKLDYLLWSLVFALIACGIGGYYYFTSQSTLLRVLGFLALLGVAIAIALRTTKGRYIWEQWLEAVQEVRMMVWPTRQETVQTTLAVLAMVVVMGILLWTADFVLLRAVAWLTGHWGA